MFYSTPPSFAQARNLHPYILVGNGTISPVKMFKKKAPFFFQLLLRIARGNLIQNPVNNCLGKIYNFCFFYRADGKSPLEIY